MNGLLYVRICAGNDALEWNKLHFTQQQKI